MKMRLGYMTWLLFLSALPGPMVWAAQNDTPAQTDLIGEIRRNMEQLRRSNLEAPPEDRGKGRLVDLINKVKDITATAAKPAPATQPASAPAMSARQAAPRSDTAAARRIPTKTLERLKSLPAEKIANPTALADALFLSGNLPAAATFYGMALPRAVDDEDKAWLTFQLANCRRETDPAQAKAGYRKLVSDYPASPYCAVARVELKLLEWLQQNDPQAILEQCKRQNPRQHPAK